MLMRVALRADEGGTQSCMPWRAPIWPYIMRVALSGARPSGRTSPRDAARSIPRSITAELRQRSHTRDNLVPGGFGSSSACRISEVVPWRLGPAPRAQTKESHRSLTGDRRRSQSVRPRLGVREVKRHLWTRPALNMALILRPRHRRPRMDRRAAPLVKWAMHSARPNFTSAAHRE